MIFHVNIINTKLEYNWNNTWHEIEVHCNLKPKGIWHQIIFLL